MFAAELAFVLTVAPRKRAALRAHWLDVAIVLVTSPLFGDLLASLRLVRLARLLRLLRASVVVARALQAERRISSGTTFRFMALATIFLVVIAGAVQNVVDEGEFHSFWDGIWWAVVTVTTVGYGDLFPTTVPGRIVGIVLMMAGIGFLAVLTATVASVFVKSDRADETGAILEALHRLETDVAEIKKQTLPARSLPRISSMRRESPAATRSKRLSTTTRATSRAGRGFARSVRALATWSAPPRRAWRFQSGAVTST